MMLNHNMLGLADINLAAVPNHFWGIISNAGAEAGSENEASSCFAHAKWPT